MSIETLLPKVQVLIRNVGKPVQLSGGQSDSDLISKEISSLVDAARTGDEDAVELLLNLSAGSRESVVASAADNALLRLYGALDTLENVRQTISAQACKLFEVSEAANKQVPDSKTSSAACSAPTFHLSVPVLYAAGQHAHKSNYPRLKNQINETLKNRCFGNPTVAKVAGETDLLTRGRFVRSEELLAATRELTALPVHGQCLELNPPADGSSFANQIQSICTEVSTQKKPRTVFLNTGDHWVTMVLVPVKVPRSNLVDAVIVDTNHEAGRDSSPVLKAVRAAFQNRFSEPVLQLGGAMQEHVPNACGPLSFALASVLDQFMAENPKADFDNLKKAIKVFVKVWNHRDPAAQDGTVTAVRGQLLATLDHSVSTN